MSRLARGFMAGVAVLIIGWPAISHSVANVARDRNPELALRMVEDHPVALSKKAADALRLDRPDDAVRFAQSAVRASAVSSDAFQVLALVHEAAGDAGLAEDAFRYTAQLNRREVPTQIWLFRQSLFRGDSTTALQHMDAAMRASRNSWTLLFPLLTSAIADDHLVEPIKAIFAKEPEWLHPFMDYSVRQGTSSVNLAEIVADLPVSSIARVEPLPARLVHRLVVTGDYVAARRFVNAITPRPTDSFIRDHSFSAPGPYKPFDWDYTSTSELRAGPSRRNGGGLQYYAATGRGGRVARQLILLEPGSYRLISAGRQLSSDSDGGASWTIRCANDQTELAQLDVVGADLPRRRQVSFTIPRVNCPAQWLDLSLRASFGPGGAEGVIESVEIRRASAPVNLSS